MAESEPLFALLELMLRTFTNNVPKMKAGGHPEEMFVNLNDEEREEIECSICYQILRDVRQCENKHKFCYSCIFVWSTSGNPVNHSRCPVCRVEGLYVRNNSLDETINSKTVKCSMKSCKWTGALKYVSSHQHTTYTDDRAIQSTDSTSASELPSVQSSSSTATTSRPTTSRSLSRASALASSAQTATGSDTPPRRQPLSTNNANSQNTARSTSVSRATNSLSTARSTNTTRTNRSTNAQNRTTNGQTTSRTRTRSRPRQSNSTSPQRRPNVTATGLNPRLMSRARIQNNGAIENSSNTSNSTVPGAVTRPINTTVTTDENQNPSTEPTSTDTVHVPRPPTTPRPTAQTPRRLPTLPSMLTTRNIEPLSTTDNNNNVNPTSNSNTETAEPTRHFSITEVRRPQNRSFGTIRDRLNESRQRLDMLMSVFSSELDRGRNNIESFHEERERRRQEQLAEVQNLGRRLTQVAHELRGLLSQRRQIRGQMDTLIQSAADDSD